MTRQEAIDLIAETVDAYLDPSVKTTAREQLARIILAKLEGSGMIFRKLKTVYGPGHNMPNEYYIGFSDERVVPNTPR